MPAAKSQNEAPKSKESAAALQAFEDYWTLGPDRSLAKLAELYLHQNNNKAASKLRTIAGWSSQFNWQERIFQRTKAENEALLEAERKANIANRAKASKKRLINSGILQGAGIAMIKSLDFSKIKPENLTQAEVKSVLSVAVKMVDVGMRAERLELGESTDNIANVPAPHKPIAEMSDEELQEYKAKILNTVESGDLA